MNIYLLCIKIQIGDEYTRLQKVLYKYAEAIKHKIYMCETEEVRLWSQEIIILYIYDCKILEIIKKEISEIKDIKMEEVVL